MKRRAFLQLGGVYASTLVVPGLLTTLSGCSTPSEDREGIPSPPASTRAGGVDPGSLATGDATRAFASDGSSVALVADEHRLLFLDAQGRQRHVVGSPEQAARLGEGSLNGPIAAAWDGERLLVLERGNARIQAFSASGAPLGIVTGTSGIALDLAVGPDRSIFVAASSAHRIDVHAPDGRLLRSIGRFGLQDGGLNGPSSVALAPNGNVHVVDAGSASVKVFTPDGTFAGGYGRGFGDARLVQPRSVRFDGAGRAWVSDLGGEAIRIYDERGAFVQKISPRLADGRRAAPLALTARADGTIYAALIAVA